MSVARSSLLMASGTVLSRILGFARAVLLAAAIGVTTDAADAFGVANQLPNNVYAIIVGGVLNAVLVPQIVRARNHLDGGKGYIDRLLTLAIVVFATVTILTTAAAPLLVSLYTSGWSSEQLALATAFAYWCLPQLFFYGLYSMLGEVLNAKSAFGPYMWAPVLNNIVSIAGLVFFVWLFGADPQGNRAIGDWGSDQIGLLGGSATLGVAVQALILFFSWHRIGLHYRLNFNWRGFGLRPALKAASWSLAMVLVSQIGGLVQTVVASGAVAERQNGPVIASVAAAAIAWLIFMLPHSVATVSIATAYFTKMSGHAHDGRIDLMNKDLASGLRAVGAIMVFSSIGLAIMAYPISRVFAGEYPALVALGNVVIAMMIGLVPFSLLHLLQRAFFALEDTRTPFFFTLAQISLHITGSITISFTVPAQWIVVALALLTSATITVQTTLAALLLRRKIGRLTGHGVGVSLLKFFGAGVPAGATGWWVQELLGGIGPGSFPVATVLSATASIFVTGFAMALVYLLVLWLLRVPEVGNAAKRIRGIPRD